MGGGYAKLSDSARRTTGFAQRTALSIDNRQRQFVAPLGVSPGCYHDVMPTRFVRIPVTKDLALAEALDRVAPLVEPNRPAATLVHDLAIRGAEELLAEHGRQADAIERLIERSTSTDPGFDVEVVQQIDELAWGLTH